MQPAQQQMQSQSQHASPQSHPAEYDASSVMTHVAGVQGALMLVHGLVDENVHFRHTARLAQSMIDSGKA